MTRDELIAALEKATGPDRELDAAIAGLINNISPTVAFEHPLYVPLEFTASIDAALTLAPEGYGCAIETRPHSLAKSRRVPAAWCSPYQDEPNIPSVGATPAIALCIACLKSREAP